MCKALYLFILVFFLAGCSFVSEDDEIQSSTEQANLEVIEKDEFLPTKELDILYITMPSVDGNVVYNCENYLKKYGSMFEEEYGVKINYHQYDLQTRVITNYYSLDPQPITDIDFDLLMLYNPFDTFDELITNEILDEFPSEYIYSEVLYDSLYGSHYIPVAVTMNTTPLNLKRLKELEIKDVNNNMSKDEYLAIIEKSAHADETYLEFFLYSELYKIYVGSQVDNLINDTSNTKYIDELKFAIGQLHKAIFEGPYTLKHNFDGNQYYNALTDPSSSEFKQLYRYFEMYRSTSILVPEVCTYSANLLNSIDASTYASEDYIMLPPIDNKLSMYGIALSSKASNHLNAFDFINFLLSQEVQISMYKEGGGIRRNVSGVVIKTIEDDVSNLHNDLEISQQSIDIRDHILESILQNDVSIMDQSSPVIQRKLFELITEYIFVKASDIDSIRFNSVLE